MHLILTGATGLVGSGVLDAMIKMKDVTKISVLSRRPIKMAEDVKDPRHALNSPPREYVRITKDFTLRAAEAFQALGSEEQPFNFVYVSGEGSTTRPGRLTPTFGRVKGETERALAEMRRANPSFRASSIRPAFVDAAQHDAIRPYVPATGAAWRAMLAVVGPPIRSLAKGSWSPTLPMGRFMAEMAMGRWEDGMRAGGPAVERIGDAMKLLNCTTLGIEEFFGSSVPQSCAILSHRWEAGEVTYQEVINLQGLDQKAGWAKVREACRVAHSKGYSYAWVDTCCINKQDLTELTEAINSMFKWYAKSAVCFAYLSDVPPGQSSIKDSLEFEGASALIFTKDITYNPEVSYAEEQAQY
ncbi:hypothetical protein INS49_009013 [Diaporthe citri]|uniref:uncharacterized protein n=1 Tax=Diaporthe citri TaxID=83186 RepID=UPI001C7ED5C8|nr:uncharacterized protein INS49_009013 [Diaporthe citri]KAG6363910.1 hypothetical protein INS49_009013 [Diaporthe citri]